MSAVQQVLAAQKRSTGGTAGGAITFVDSGTTLSAGNTSNPSVVCPATVAAGNGLLAAIVSRNSAGDTPTMPSPWVFLGTVNGGSGAWGASDSGDARTTLYWLVADGTEDGSSVTITWPAGSASSIGAKIYRFSKTNTNWVTPVVSTGVDSTPATPFTATGGSAVEWLTNDMAFAAMGSNSDIGYLTPVISASGVTFDTATAQLSANLGGGWGGHQLGATAAVTSGTATPAAPTISYTPSETGTNNPAGSAIIARLRDAA